MAPECSETATKGMRVTKLLSSHKSRYLTYLDYMNKKPHSNTFIFAFLSMEIVKLLIDLPSEKPFKFPWQLVLQQLQ